MKNADGRPKRSRPPRRPDFGHLETFLKVVETRSFAAAARQLGVSQPAVSQTIAKLEEIYGGDLFERRRGSPVALTPIGRAILPNAKMLLFTVDQQVRHAIAIAQSAVGSLTIGFQPGLARGALGVGLKEFIALQPDVQLRFVEAIPGELYRQVNERSVDIIFTGLLPDLTNGPNAQERLWSEPLVVALRDDHPLATKKKLCWDDLSPLPIILSAPSGDLSCFRALAARMGDLSFECEMHDVSHAVLIEMVKLGLGTTIQFAAAALPREGIAYLPVSNKNAFVGIDSVWPKEDRNPLRHRLLSCVRQHIRLMDVNKTINPAASTSLQQRS